MSTPHRGISETIIIKILKKYSKIIDKQLLRNYLHIKFMTLKTDLKGRLSFYVYILLLCVVLSRGDLKVVHCYVTIDSQLQVDMLPWFCVITKLSSVQGLEIYIYVHLCA